jgi:RNA polymerase sigma-70 factor (ECF subfamily)
VFRHEQARAVATLIRVLGDFDRAEDAVQEAFVEALRTWPTRELPVNPAAWIITTARNRAIDRIRREQGLQAKTEQLAREMQLIELADLWQTPESEAGMEIADDRLRLIFTCCHPALDVEARVALTLRTLGGLTTAEISRAFLVAEPTMAKRLVRAKAKIREARIPYRVPPAELLAERLAGVRTVLYLVFNEGYSATSDALLRIDLCDEAIRLARLVDALVPNESESIGLLALMLLQHSRRDARTTHGGQLVLLEDQDRSRWDHELIDEGLRHVETALSMRQPGPYQLQAAIAALHARAPRPEDTDWPQIATLYSVLYAMQPSPVVALNRAAAIAMADGAAAALPLLDELAAPLERYYLFHATKADLLRRIGRNDEATANYERALQLATNPAERAFLAGRLTEVGTSH